MPLFESPSAAPDCVGTLRSPSYHPVVEAAPPADCATGSNALTRSNRLPLLKPFSDAMMRRGLSACTASQPNPSFSTSPGPMFSTNTSASLSRSVRIFLPSGFFMFNVTDFLLALSCRKYREYDPSTSFISLRVGSPPRTFSTLMTSAPIHASICVHDGPDCTCVQSMTLTPFSGAVSGTSSDAPLAVLLAMSPASCDGCAMLTSLLSVCRLVRSTYSGHP